MGSRTEEEGNLTNQEEVEVVGEAEVEVGKQEQVAGSMTMMISALISVPLVPAGVKLKSST